jgi:hypothetical protein
MVRYLGEPEPAYNGDEGGAKTKVNMWGGSQTDTTPDAVKGLNTSSMAKPSLEGYLMGFSRSPAKAGIPSGIGPESNIGFGPGGVATKGFGSLVGSKNLNVDTGKAMPKHMIAPKKDSDFMASEGTFPSL